MDIDRVVRGLCGYMNDLGSTLQKLDTRPIARMVEVIFKACEEGKKVFTMGNGGHANTAAHMINDIAKHTISSDEKDTVVSEKRFRTLCLNDSVSLLTAIANDMGYDHVFSEQLANWCEEGDVVIGISGSGNSRNILKAFEVAKSRGATSICLTGKGGGKAKEVADICILVPGDKMVQIEDVHLAITHAVSDELKKIVQGRAELEG